TVSSGTLVLSKSPGVTAIAHGALAINTGGVVLLGASDQIDDAVTLTLAGGVFQTGGYNEQLSTLKLTASSRLDLGSGASVLKFAASSGIGWTTSTILTVSNWNGSVLGGGNSQLIFGANATGLTAGQVAQIRFINPVGFS